MSSWRRCRARAQIDNKRRGFQMRRSKTQELPLLQYRKKQKPRLQWSARLLPQQRKAGSLRVQPGKKAAARAACARSSR